MATSEVKFKPHLRDVDNLMRDPVFGNSQRSIQDQFGTEITLRAQPRFQRQKDQQPSKTGDDHYSWAWFNISAHELRVKGVVDPLGMKNGLITEIQRQHGRDPEEYVVTEVKPQGHLRGGPVFFQLFVDKLKATRGTA